MAASLTVSVSFVPSDATEPSYSGAGTIDVDEDMAAGVDAVAVPVNVTVAAADGSVANLVGTESLQLDPLHGARAATNATDSGEWACA